MKIVYLLPSAAISGGGKVVLQQADELGRRGHRVTVVCPDAAPDWYSLRHARFERSPFESSESLPSADVAVATFWTTIEPALALSSKKVFHLCQGLESDSAFYAARKGEIEAAYRKIPKKIAISTHVREFLERRGFRDVAEVGETFEAGEFRVDGRIFTRDPLRVLLVGVWEVDIKGIVEAVESLRRLREEGARFRLLRVSPEPMCEAEQRSRVVDEYHRALSPRRVPEMLGYADLFLGPNHEVEGFGLPTLEALAAGLPAALSDTPSHRSMAGDSAIFFEPRDSEGICRAVSRLLAEEATRRRLSAEGPARAARFRTVDVGDRLEDVLRKAADV